MLVLEMQVSFPIDPDIIVEFHLLLSHFIIFERM